MKIDTKNLMKKIEQYQEGMKDSVYVGYAKNGSMRYEENPKVTTADVAMFNEFGTATIPARPFFRTAWQSFIAAMNGKLKESIRQFRKGKYEKSLSFAAVLFTNEVKLQITNGNWVPNALSTIKAKSKKTTKDKPLIDTGNMKNDIQVWRE